MKGGVLVEEKDIQKEELEQKLEENSQKLQETKKPALTKKR